MNGYSLSVPEVGLWRVWFSCPPHPHLRGQLASDQELDSPEARTGHPAHLQLQQLHTPQKQEPSLILATLRLSDPCSLTRVFRRSPFPNPLENVCLHNGHRMDSGWIGAEHNCKRGATTSLAQRSTSGSCNPPWLQHEDAPEGHEHPQVWACGCGLGMCFCSIKS